MRLSGVGRPALEALATSGALAGLGDASVRAGRNRAAADAGDSARRLTRREALWAAGAAAEARPDRLPGTVVGTNPPLLPEMDEIEEMSADLETLGLSPGASPMSFARARLADRGVVPNARSREGARRRESQRCRSGHPSPAACYGGGDDVSQLGRRDGLVNVIARRDCWTRYRKAARAAAVLLVRGTARTGRGG